MNMAKCCVQNEIELLKWILAFAPKKNFQNSDVFIWSLDAQKFDAPFELESICADEHS